MTSSFGVFGRTTKRLTTLCRKTLQVHLEDGRPRSLVLKEIYGLFVPPVKAYSLPTDNLVILVKR